MCDTLSIYVELLLRASRTNGAFTTQGERATSMFFISTGTVGVFVVPESDDPFETPGDEDYVISLGAGSFFGEVSLLEEVFSSSAAKPVLRRFVCRPLSTYIRSYGTPHS